MGHGNDDKRGNRDANTTTDSPACAVTLDPADAPTLVYAFRSATTLFTLSV